ncbi:MAG TPA: serine/threonine-protein kinase [Pyrinomonadaceae bacterium]|jgi:serine/threonine protein kinase
MDVPHIIAGRFRIECEIGTGGMGTVYRATHLGLERPVAVKIIKPEFASDPDVTERFMREARTMAKLRHPHAAMIFDAGHLPDGRHFIVMEYVEGSTLSEILAREGRFTPERAVRIASDICEVLAEAHKLGIIHRDLKPSNIMLNERGVCVLDFGVAKVLATSGDATATHATTGSGIIIGTPRYMSPEQCLGQRVGARSDLYSLGVLLYEMLAGRPPFVDALPSAVLVRQATAAPPPLPQVRGDVPRALALAVHCLLAKRPEDRPMTAEAARVLLERSIMRPASTLPEEQPFASTVAALNTGRSLFFRAIMPLAVVAVLGGLLLVWGSGLQNNSQAATSPSTESGATDVASRTSSSLAARPAPILNSARMPSTDDARRIVNSLSHGPVSDVRVIRNGRGAAILALHDERSAGTSHLFMLERQSAAKGYRITGRAPLDTPDFSGAEWKAESLDVDGDGSEEVLYTGMQTKGAKPSGRLVLYAPRKRRAYAVGFEAGGRNQKPARPVWSANALTEDALLYRAFLQHRMRTLLTAK